MRALVFLAVVGSMAGCGGLGTSLPACFDDGQACTTAAECCGTASVSSVAPGVNVTAVEGTCFAGACCTQYDSPGWRCVVCNGKPTCWTVPAPTPPTPPADMARLDFDALPHCHAQVTDAGQGPMYCDGGA